MRIHGVLLFPWPSGLTDVRREHSVFPFARLLAQVF